MSNTAGGIRAGHAYVELTANSTPLTIGLRKAEIQLRNFASAMTMVGSRLFGLGLMGAMPLGLSAKHFAELDDSLRMVKAVTGATEKEFKKLSDTARLLGRTTSFTSKQVAEAMGELGRAGFKTKEIEDMIAHVMNLSRATRTSIPVAANAAAAALRQFGMESSETGRVVDVMTAAANNSAQTLEDIATSFRYAAPVAKEFNMTIEDTSKLIGALANQGLRNEMAGTTLRNLMARIGSNDVQAKFKEIGVELRKDNAVRPLVDILHDVGKRMKELNMDALERAEWFHQAFGLRSMAGGSKLVSQVFNDLNEALDNAADTAARTAADMDKGLGGTLRLLTSAVQGLMEAIGEALTGKLMDLGKWAINTINSFTEWIKVNNQAIVIFGQLTTTIAGVGAAVLALGGAIATLAAIVASINVLVSTTLGIWATGIAAIVGIIALAVAFADKFGMIDVQTKIFGKTYRTEMETAAEKTRRTNEEADKLMKKLETLNDANVKTPDIIEAMNDSIRELNDNYGDLGLSINNATKEVEGLADAHEKLAKAQKEATVEAQKNRLAEAVYNRQVAESKIRDLVEEHSRTNWFTAPIGHAGETREMWAFNRGAGGQDKYKTGDYIQVDDPAGGKTYYIKKQTTSYNALGGWFTGPNVDDFGGYDIEKELRQYIQARDKYTNIAAEAEINSALFGREMTATPNVPSIGAASMTPWVAKMTERQDPLKTLEEFTKLAENKNKTLGTELASVTVRLSQANEDLDDEIKTTGDEFRHQLAQYMTTPRDLMIDKLFDKDMLGRMGFFAGEFRAPTFYATHNYQLFEQDSAKWVNRIEEAFFAEQDEQKKQYINTYLEQFKQFREEYTQHLKSGGSATSFDMSQFSDLFAYMTNIMFVDIENQGKKEMEEARQQLEKNWQDKAKIFQKGSPHLEWSASHGGFVPVKTPEYLGDFYIDQSKKDQMQWSEDLGGYVVDQAQDYMFYFKSKEQRDDYINRELEKIYSGWGEKYSSLENSKALNSAFSAFTQAKTKKEQINELAAQIMGRMIEDDPAYQSFKNYLASMDKNGELSEIDKKMLTLMDAASKARQDVEDVYQEAKKNGATGITENGKWTEVEDWDTWRQDNLNKLDEVFEISKNAVFQESAIFEEAVAVLEALDPYQGMTSYQRHMAELDDAKKSAQQKIDKMFEEAKKIGKDTVTIDGEEYTQDQLLERVNNYYDKEKEDFHKENLKTIANQVEGFVEEGTKTTRTDQENAQQSLKKQWEEVSQAAKKAHEEGIYSDQQYKKAKAQIDRSYKQQLKQINKKYAEKPEEAKPMAEEIRNAWETGTTEYDMQISQISQQIADLNIQRQAAVNSGQWDEVALVDWNKKQLDFKKTQLEYNRAVAYNEYALSEQAKAQEEYKTARKEYKHLENRADDDEEKVAAAKKLNEALTNLGKWNRDVDSSASSIEQAASQLNKVENIQEALNNAYNVTQQISTSSMGTFNPFEVLQGVGAFSIETEMQTQTGLLTEIRDNTEEGAWL